MSEIARVPFDQQEHKNHNNAVLVMDHSNMTSLRISSQNLEDAKTINFIKIILNSKKLKFHRPICNLKVQADWFPIEYSWVGEVWQYGMYIERIVDHPDIEKPIEKMPDFEMEIKQIQTLSSLFAWPHFNLIASPSYCCWAPWISGLIDGTWTEPKCSGVLRPESRGCLIRSCSSRLFHN